jgi:hypothetical protein
LTCGYPIFVAPFVEEAVFSPTSVFGAFVENPVAAAVWVYFWVLLFIASVFVSGFVIITLKSGIVILSSVALFPQIPLTIWGFCTFIQILGLSFLFL